MFYSLRYFYFILFILLKSTILSAQPKIFDKLQSTINYSFELERQENESIEGQVQRKDNSFFWQPKNSLDPSVLISPLQVIIYDYEFEVATIWPTRRLEGLDPFFEIWRFLTLYEDQRFIHPEGKIETQDLQQAQRFIFQWNDDQITIECSLRNLDEKMTLSVFLKEKTQGLEDFDIPKGWDIEKM